MTDSIDVDRSNRNIEQPPESVRRIPIDHVYGIIYCTTQELFEFGTSQLSFNETGEKSTNEGRRGIKYIYISQHRAADIGTRKKRSNTTANTVYILDHF